MKEEGRTMFGGLSEDFMVKIRSQVNPGFHLSSLNY